MHSTLVFLLATSIAAVVAIPAAAHELWIEPRPAHPVAGEPYAVTIFTGDGIADPHPVRRDEAHIRRFATLDAGGERPVNGLPGLHPAGLARGFAEGDQVLIYETGFTPIELPAERFESYLENDGLERIAAARAARGESGTPARELFARCAKSVVRARGAGGGETWSRSARLTLELLPERDPLDFNGDPLPVRLLFRGEPLAGALIVARRRTDGGEHRVAARTNAEGRALLPLDRDAFWLLGAVHMIAAEPDAGADWRSWWASLTFDSRVGPRG